MDCNIKKWLSHMNSINSTDRKRKRNDDDVLIKELTYHAIECVERNIIDNNIKINDLDSFITCTGTLLTHCLVQFDADPIISNNQEMLLFMHALVTVSLQVLDTIKTARGKALDKFNVKQFLATYKKQFNIPVKQKKLNHMPLLDFTFDECADGEDDDYVEDEIETEDDGDVFEPNTDSSVTFMTHLKQLSNSLGSSREEMMNYFNRMNSKNKTDAISKLSEVSNFNHSNIPYIFRILQSPLNILTKKNIMSKILHLNSGTTENGKARKWVDDVMKLPFGVYKGIELRSISNKPTKVKQFLKKLETTMDNAVYGHTDAKKQIVQVIAQTIRNPTCKGNVIGIWGPPGNGKTTLIKEGIAKAMDKPFVFVSLGGATDGSFLDGHSFTYEGSIYGRIAQAIIDAKCMNPIIYFDELDKVSKCIKGDEVINMLIHLVDPAQNQLFRDKYFYDVDIDLSKVTFIFSFNDMSQVNYILKDRITMIETTHLSCEQKIHIGTHYLMHDICKDVGINVDDVIVPPEIMVNIINNYTYEGGVRHLKEHLYKIVRELNHANLTGNHFVGERIRFPMTFTEAMYMELFSNIPKYNHMTVHKTDGIGMVNGLWADSMGLGGVLPIESVLIPTKELLGVKTTGSLGNVIKESIDVALSVAWNKLDDATKNRWMEHWKNGPECFHVHCPDGATHKEGPSAGTAMSLAFYSRLTGRRVRHTVAMTGEMNLREEVTEIGGLDRKLSAAKRGGATLVLVPKNNETDLDNIKKLNPTLIDDNFVVVCVENFDQVIERCLI